MTKGQLLRFVKRRNDSAFASNLQFQIDANGCGFSVDELGPVQRFTVDGFTGYQWKVPTKEGTRRMVEFGRLLYVEHEPGSENMFELMSAATFVELDKLQQP